MKRVRSSAFLAVALLATVACIHKTGGTQVTPWERVHTYNAALATANNAVEQGAEATVTSGLTTAPEMAPIINWTGRVAMLHQQITSILAQGSATQANVASVKGLVDAIKASIAELPAPTLGLKNPRTQQSFQQDVQALGALADSLLSALSAAGAS